MTVVAARSAVGTRTSHRASARDRASRASRASGAQRIHYNARVHLHRGNLYLVGLPGAGKSTLGRQLARRLDKTFVDADAELERKLGVTIPTIFEIEGEASFRDREEAVLAELTALHRHRARDRRRRRHPAREPRAPEAERDGDLPARDAGNAARAHAPEPASAAPQRGRPDRAPGGALRGARCALSRGRGDASSNPIATRSRSSRGSSRRRCRIRCRR